MIPILFVSLLAQVTQQGTPTPTPAAITLGEWIAATALGLTVLGGAFKLGGLASDHQALRSSLETQLTAIRGVLDGISEYMAETQRLRLDWAGFRTVVEETTDLHSRQIATLTEGATEHTHKMRNVEQAVALVSQRVDVVERRHGPPGRRTADGGHE